MSVIVQSGNNGRIVWVLYTGLGTGSNLIVYI